MDAKAALQYLDSLQGHGMQFRLEAMNAMLAARGNFHLGLKVVHIGGSNGKGSVTALVTAALREQGYRVGTYTSPHLVAFDERIVVDGKPIPPDALAAIVADVRPVIERVKGEVGNVTYFEAVTLVAIEHFRRERVDVAVLEVGLGGRLDATNVFPAPLASVITNVSLEHTNYLGDTVEKIAIEKAEIIKPGRPVVTAATDEALDVILAKAEDVGAPTVIMHFDFQATRESFDRDSQRLRVTGLPRDYGPLTLRLLGAHQVENAAVAVACLDTLNTNGLAVSVDAVRRGLEKARWAGRLQFVPGKPTILLDGAHNAAGAEALAAFLQEQQLRPVALFGCLADKDWLTMVNTLAPHLKAVVVTTPNFPGRALPAMESAREFSRAGTVATIVDPTRFALATAFDQAGEDGVVLVTGSLYLVGEVMGILREYKKL